MSDATFEFSGDLTIYQVQETRDRLREAWASGVRRFDAQQLTSLDGSGAQLLVSLFKTAAANQQTIEWSGWSSEALEALQLMGLRKLADSGTV
jgi:anti-anti-sigma regulatory factor